VSYLFLALGLAFVDDLLGFVPSVAAHDGGVTPPVAVRLGLVAGNIEKLPRGGVATIRSTDPEEVVRNGLCQSAPDIDFVNTRIG
jgi:hypothetical protein